MAHAADPDLAAELAQLRRELARQADRLSAQEKALAAQAASLAEQRAQLARQQRDLETRTAVRFDDRRLAALRGAGNAQERSAELPGGPVGEAPKAPEIAPEYAALPQDVSVLLRKNQFVIEPSIEYTRSSQNRLVFRGIEVTAGVQLGVIEASDASRDTLVGVATLRYGATDRLEFEARVPYVYRADRITTLQQRDQTVSRNISLDGRELGDVELGARYQLNRGLNGWPVLVGSVRYKSDTGSSPFEIPRDEFGIAQRLNTGSGFPGIEGGLTALLPSDPVVLYGSFSYLYNMPKTIGKTIGGVLVGEVDPGDSIGIGLGFGFALNQDFSFSLGYRHNFLYGTHTQLNDTRQRSTSLHVGAMTMGLSYRLSQRTYINAGFEFGATSDAPDMRFILRVPFTFSP